MSTTTANVIADNNQNFSLNGEWLIQCLVYKATSTTSNNSFVYYGTSVGEFKTRYNNHTKSFRHRECMKETELSKPVWKLKDHCLDNNLSSEIHKKVSPCQCVSKRCDLCLIIYADPDTLLNKRTELISRCRHIWKYIGNIYTIYSIYYILLYIYIYIYIIYLYMWSGYDISW